MYGEDRFLDLAGIGRAGDQDRLRGERQRDDGAAAAAVDGGVGLEFRGVQDGPVRGEAVQRILRRADEHVAREQRMPRIGRDQAHANLVRSVGAGMQVLGEQFRLLAEIGAHLGGQSGELIRGQLLIDLAPPDRLGRFGLIDHELVLHRAAGVLAGDRDEGAVRGQPALPAPKRLGDQDRSRQVCVNLPARGNAGAGEGGVLGRHRGPLSWGHVAVR
jgi:hypothetical protein